MNAFNIVKTFHILFAIVAVGFNLSYAIWLARGSMQPEHESFALKTIKLIDGRMANPAYGLLLLSGLLMVYLGHLNILRTFWLGAALVLYLIAVLMAALGYTPALRKQIQALETQGRESGDYQAAARRQTVLGVAVMVPIILIIILMVNRPTL